MSILYVSFMEQLEYSCIYSAKNSDEHFQIPFFSLISPGVDGHL